MSIENFPKPHTPDSLSNDLNNQVPTAEEIVWGTAQDQEIRKHEMLRQVGILQDGADDFSGGGSAPKDHFMTPGENTDF